MSGHPAKRAKRTRIEIQRRVLLCKLCADTNKVQFFFQRSNGVNHLLDTLTHAAMNLNESTVNSALLVVSEAWMNKKEEEILRDYHSVPTYALLRSRLPESIHPLSSSSSSSPSPLLSSSTRLDIPPIPNVSRVSLPLPLAPVIHPPINLAEQHTFSHQDVDTPSHSPTNENFEAPSNAELPCEEEEEEEEEEHPPPFFPSRISRDLEAHQRDEIIDFEEDLFGLQQAEDEIDRRFAVSPSEIEEGLDAENQVHRGRDIPFHIPHNEISTQDTVVDPQIFHPPSATFPFPSRLFQKLHILYCSASRFIFAF